MTAFALPVVTESGVSNYLSQINSFPYLSEDDEFMLAKRWTDQEDVDAAHQLVMSHLRLVVKIANGYKGYGLPFMELVSEGNIGLMQAVKKFDPDKGFRLSTYAMWWIKASIQEYILRSWSLVKIGTTAAQKKLFFGLRKVKNRIKNFAEGLLDYDEATSAAKELNVSQSEVIEMDSRLSQNDASLNEPISHDDGSSGEWIDFVESDDNHEITIIENDSLDHQKSLLYNAMEDLNDREKDIIVKRRLSENPSTLEDLSQLYGISRERVRQIEARAFEKLQESLN